MTFIRRLMEIKEEQIGFELVKIDILTEIKLTLTEILKVLKGRKDGKRKIYRKNYVLSRIKRR